MVAVSRLEKTLGDNWTHLDITTPVSGLSRSTKSKQTKLG